MCTLLRFPIEQCRPVNVAHGQRLGEVVIFPGVQIERNAVSITAIAEDTKVERREG